MKAKLTPEQVKRYGEVFATVIPKSSYRTADALAWQGLCEEWPELSVFNFADAGVYAAPELEDESELERMRR